jgi:predicted unusual protein kinase regulating ubiquinone biosynthesis (AarF/ABC1/UbiB family)
MVQELMEGRKLNQEIVAYQDTIPKLGLALVEHLANVWASEAFFRSGLFHADLHQGNFLVNVTDHEIILPPLDFGMGGVLSSDVQKQLLLFGIGLKLQRADLVAQALWAASVTHLNTMNELQFSQLVLDRMNSLRGQPSSEVVSSDWLNWALDAGLRLPYELISLNRGILIMDQALKEVGSQLTVGSISEGLVPKLARSTVIHWYKDGTLTTKDLLKLGLALMQSPAAAASRPVAKPAGVAKPLLCVRAHSKAS